MKRESGKRGVAKDILDALNRLEGVLAWKIHGNGYQEAGIPDILACVRGIFIGLEVKRPAPRSRVSPTPIQRRQLGRIAEAGGVAFVVTSIAEALTIAREVLRQTQTASLAPSSLTIDSLDPNDIRSTHDATHSLPSPPPPVRDVLLDAGVRACGSRP